ncbi:homocysteine S-methyltransferase family protein [Flavimaricola marinus]|uniref:Homocysteine S-methyltransferase n=1 Tax=Flavimaricola marinus TaxID=1819565 RepID=A0A238LH37_9RHOB|nr:homocysteine S-methyltransferase family protein [Flavimaricola marinus]SMY08200.1 Homocysteine S-methyltransferase [Flavimaricola marinus]
MVDVVLLDGGMGQELVHRAGDRPTPLWSTQVMVDRPGLVAEVHRDFYAAGATVATCNTYAVHHDRLVGTPMEGQFSQLHDIALAEANAARVEGGRVAGSIGPLGATYRPDVHPDYDTSVPMYAEFAAKIAQQVDFIICETVASLLHARSILDGCRDCGVPVWLSVTVDDEDGSLLRSGEPVAEVCAIAVEGGAEAVLANCSAPEAMPAALAALKGAGLPMGAYANGFTRITKEFLGAKPTVDALITRQDLSPESYARMALSWVDQGATIVGGCCEVGPAHIAAVAEALRAAGHVIR